MAMTLQAAINSASLYHEFGTMTVFTVSMHDDSRHGAGR